MDRQLIAGATLRIVVEAWPIDDATPINLSPIAGAPQLVLRRMRSDGAGFVGATALSVAGVFTAASTGVPPRWLFELPTPADLQPGAYGLVTRWPMAGAQTDITPVQRVVVSAAP